MYGLILREKAKMMSSSAFYSPYIKSKERTRRLFVVTNAQMKTPMAATAPPVTATVRFPNLSKKLPDIAPANNNKNQ